MRKGQRFARAFKRAVAVEYLYTKGTDTVFKNKL